ncbi:hypothetical protein SLEP1_g46715 [Rubroshorea leprosula]|uniref:Uncharacterized protein n=1 Tax=Rubroshorea leprosula TaxID=152421 RepID=A0AAV5LN55_9ROSI|nr:hypothetical protein SLEP1_g46715 [Rubroshorea leprosula]
MLASKCVHLWPAPSDGASTFRSVLKVRSPVQCMSSSRKIVLIPSSWFLNQTELYLFIYFISIIPKNASVSCRRQILSSNYKNLLVV